VLIFAKELLVVKANSITLKNQRPSKSKRELSTISAHAKGTRHWICSRLRFQGCIRWTRLRFSRPYPLNEGSLAVCEPPVRFEPQTQRFARVDRKGRKETSTFLWERTLTSLGLDLHFDGGVMVLGSTESAKTE